MRCAEGHTKKTIHKWEMDGAGISVPHSLPLLDLHPSRCSAWLWCLPRLVELSGYNAWPESLQVPLTGKLHLGLWLIDADCCLTRMDGPPRSMNGGFPKKESRGGRGAKRVARCKRGAGSEDMVKASIKPGDISWGRRASRRKKVLEQFPCCSPGWRPHGSQLHVTEVQGRELGWCLGGVGSDAEREPCGPKGCVPIKSVAKIFASPLW